MKKISAAKMHETRMWITQVIIPCAVAIAAIDKMHPEYKTNAKNAISNGVKRAKDKVSKLFKKED